MTRYAVTVDAGLRDLRAADHLLRTLAAELALPQGVFGCTHLVRGERPRVVVSLAVEEETVAADVRERLAAQGHEVADGVPDPVGRAVLYPGADVLRGTMTIAEVLSASAIDRVTVLGAAGRPAPEARLTTREHVRPQWQDGQLVLTAMPAVGGTLVPFEVPDPTPCCADH
ncbi:hypothetical protein ACH4F6_03650 [Streptomyces sp. NPDC017936]|uniref:hypothetical protein n=1 Tax=Streptomyces sp. NPDC017936 TaxID=3365016 RepID=UPI003790BDE7